MTAIFAFKDTFQIGELNMQQIKVAKTTKIARLAQSIAIALRQDDHVQVTAAGKEACYVMMMGIASLNALTNIPNVKMHIERHTNEEERAFSVIVCDVFKGEEN